MVGVNARIKAMHATLWKERNRRIFENVLSMSLQIVGKMKEIVDLHKRAHYFQTHWWLEFSIFAHVRPCAVTNSFYG
jgi:hypothetical protein